MQNLQKAGDVEFVVPADETDCRRRIAECKATLSKIDLQFSANRPIGRLPASKWHEHLDWRRRALGKRYYVAMELGYLKAWLRAAIDNRTRERGALVALLRRAIAANAIDTMRLDDDDAALVALLKATSNAAGSS